MNSIAPYPLALAIVVTFVPWTETGAAIVTQSPFVRVFAHSGIRHAAGIMNFVVLSAALSSMGLTLLCAVLVTMGLDKETWQISWIVGVPWVALISVVYFILKARGALGRR